MPELLRGVWFKKQPFPQCVPKASPNTSWSQCRLLGYVSGAAGSACGSNCWQPRRSCRAGARAWQPQALFELLQNLSPCKRVSPDTWLWCLGILTWFLLGLAGLLFLHSHFFLYSAKIYTDTAFSADKCKLVLKEECTSLIPCAWQLTTNYFYLSRVRSWEQGESTAEMAARYLERSRK